MNQKEWYMKILNWAETDSRLNLKYMDMVVLAEHLANEERGLTKRAPDAAPRPPFLDRFTGAVRVTLAVGKQTVITIIKKTITIFYSCGHSKVLGVWQEPQKECWCHAPAVKIVVELIRGKEIKYEGDNNDK